MARSGGGNPHRQAVLNTHPGAAAASAQVQVDDRAFQVALKEWARRAKAETRADVFKLAIVVQNEARRLAPVDTGRLRSSITVKRTPDGAVVGSNVEYAPYVEYGTSRMAAQPYLRPAVLIAVGKFPSLVKS